MSDPSTTSSPDRAAAPSTLLLALRGAVGGALMGVANLVPGISGGTMLVAAGIYPRFVEAVAQATRLRFTRQALVVLGAIGGAAVVAIVALAGVLGQLVVEQTWIMYSIFIGLTLGGVPVVWAMCDRHNRTFWLGAAAGVLAMSALATVQMLGLGTEGAGEAGTMVLILAGTAAAGAMILPGLSGGYLFLVLGVYVTILEGIDRAARAARDAAWEQLGDPVVGVIVPVAVGMAVGIAVVSNALKLVLDRFPRAVLGVLVGLLLGAVVGLWPFQHGVAPEPGDVIKGQRVVEMQGQLHFETTAEPVEPRDYPRRFFRPGGAQILGSLALIGAGMGVTGLLARLGRERPGASPRSAA